MTIVSNDVKKTVPSVGAASRTWRDLQQLFIEMDAGLCEAHWRFDCATAVRDDWSLRLNERDSDSALLVQTLREAGRKVRLQSGSHLVPRRWADDLSDPLESWLVALRHNRVNCEYVRGEWRVEIGVIHSLPKSSAILCGNLANRFGRRSPA